MANRLRELPGGLAVRRRTYLGLTKAVSGPRHPAAYAAGSPLVAARSRLPSWCEMRGSPSMNQPVYILERYNWRRAGGHWLSLPGSDRLRSFTDRAEAEARCREMEWELRRKINPFVCGPFLHYQTSFDAPRLFDWCLDAGLEPPGVTNDSRIWADWWARHRKRMTDRQRAIFWDALDHVRFYRIEESEASVPCHLVATQQFEWDYMADPRYGLLRYVGCTPYLLAREQATADNLCHQLFLDQLARAGDYIGDMTEPSSWMLPEIDPFNDPDEPVPDIGAERRPIELFADRPARPGQDVFVVLRRHWRLEESAGGFWRWSLTERKSCGRPIAAFTTLAAADACQAKLEAEARRTPALFRFGPPHEWSTLDAGAIYGMLSQIAPIDFATLWNDYKASDQAWCRWWDECAWSLTPEQIETIWSLYDRLKFYEIKEVEYRE
jgi:hypothetical protein